MIKITLILSCVFVVIFSSISLALPRVDNVTHDTNTGTIQILGRYFGFKSPAAPILWEDFEDGTPGNNLSSTGKWVGLSSWPGGQFSQERPYSGSLSAFNRIAGSEAVGPDMGDFNTSQFQFAGTDKLYYSYRWYGQVNDPERLSLMRTIRKQGRMSAATNNSGYTGPGSMYYSHGGVAYDPGDGWKSYGSVGNPSLGEWHRHELYKEMSTPGIADGRVMLIANNNIRIDDIGVMTRNTGESFQHELVLLGLMAAGYKDSPLTDMSFFVDDVYVDNTLARVELGDHPDFWSAKNREIQIPTEWTDTQIKVNINLGRFNNVENLFLYVVDAEGKPSQGYGPLGASSILPPPKLELISE